jgi:hypothetical protein
MYPRNPDRRNEERDTEREITYLHPKIWYKNQTQKMIVPGVVIHVRIHSRPLVIPFRSVVMSVFKWPLKFLVLSCFFGKALVETAIVDKTVSGMKK